MLPHIQLGGVSPQGFVVPTFPKYQTDGKPCPVSDYKGFYNQRGYCIPATAQNYPKPEHKLPKQYQIKKESNILFEKSISPAIPNKNIISSQRPGSMSLGTNDEDIYGKTKLVYDQEERQLCLKIGHHYLPKSNKCMRCGISR